MAEGMGRYMAKPAGSKQSSEDASPKDRWWDNKQDTEKAEAIPVDGSADGLSGERGEGWLYRKLWSFQKDSVTAKRRKAKEKEEADTKAV